MDRQQQGPLLVNTPDIGAEKTHIRYARTKDGKINLGAYKGKKGRIVENNLTINVKILEARTRYGHLDLKVSPIAGEGEVWVERKNIQIDNDPAYVKAHEVSRQPTSISLVDAEKMALNTMNAKELRDLVSALVGIEKKNSVNEQPF